MVWMRGVDARGVGIVQQHVIAAERAHVRDAIAHLPGANDADRAKSCSSLTGHSALTRR